MSTTETPMGRCQWFLRCTHDAVRMRRHPTLERVPVCASCDLSMGPETTGDQVRPTDLPPIIVARLSGRLVRPGSPNT